MRNLSYFMKETKEEIVKVKAPESFKDENGNVIDMEVKLLSNQHINKIREKYRRRSIALDKKGNPYISNGEVAFKTEDNFSKFLRHILAEAIVYPDMRSKEIMEFYNCYDVSEIPLRVFSDMEEYNYVFKKVLTLLGVLPKDEENTDDKDIEEAKN